MTGTDARFAGSIPQLYEQYLVPLLFEPYAQDLARRLDGSGVGTLLELAAGTGAVTRVLAEKLPTTQIVATDLNPGMLRIGESRSSNPAVRWQQADAQQLPLGDAEVDAVVCQFGVMFLPDKRAGYREARRVLKAGARYLFNVWDRLEHNEVSLIVDRAVAALFPNDPPRFMARTPFGYFDVDAIRSDLSAAGFQRIEVDTVVQVSRATSAADVAVGLCQGTPLRGEIETRDAARLDEATAAAKAALIARFGPEAFDNRMQALVVTAHAP